MVSRANLASSLVSCRNFLAKGKVADVIDEEENQLVATQYFIELVIGSTYFGHHYAHRQEL
jgi:hypothetical protein